MTAVRQTYSIFEAPGLLLRTVLLRVAGKKDVTAKAVVEQAKRTKHAPNSLMALNILYVLAAIGMAEHRVAGSYGELRFSIKKGKPNQALHLTAGV
jgi:hypothetical protein